MSWRKVTRPVKKYLDEKIEFLSEEDVDDTLTWNWRSGMVLPESKQSENQEVVAFPWKVKPPQPIVVSTPFAP